MLKLKRLLKKNSGRSNGTVTVRHQGGRHKRFLREVDFKRNKKDIWAKVGSVEYDPNRNAQIAKVVYQDGTRSYIIAPVGLKVDMKVIASSDAPLEVGNCLPLSKIPVGTAIHNIEIKPGRGAQIARGAGIVAFVFGKDETSVLVKMPSTEIRRFDPNACAVIGQVGNADFKNRKLGKAGASRWRGIRPSVRGVVMHPNAHPHGGGEGRSGIGLKYPKTPWGKKAVGKTRTKRKYSNAIIVQGRKRGKAGLFKQYMSRSAKKGPYVDDRLIKKLEKGLGLKESPIKTWSRACKISPEFVNKYFQVHNGKIFIDVFVTEDMVGHTLGEFSPTRLFKGHGEVVKRTMDKT